MIRSLNLTLFLFLLITSIALLPKSAFAQQGWTDLGTLPSKDVQIDIDACGRLWAQTPNRFYVSEDLGATWQDLEVLVNPEIELSNIIPSEAGPLISYTMHARFGYAVANKIPCSGELELPNVLDQPGIPIDSFSSNLPQVARQASNYIYDFPPISVVDDQVLVYTFHPSARFSPAQYLLTAKGDRDSPYISSRYLEGESFGYLFLDAPTGDSLLYTNMPRSTYVFDGVDTFKIAAPLGIDTVYYASREADSGVDTSVFVYRKNSFPDSITIANYYWETQSWEELQSIYSAGETQVLPKGHYELIIKTTTGFHHTQNRGTSPLLDMSIAPQVGELVGYVPQEMGVLLLDSGQYSISSPTGYRQVAHNLGNAVEDILLGDAGVVAFNGSNWYTMSSSSNPTLIDISNGYDVHTHVTNTHAYTQTITSEGLVLLARSASGADTLFRKLRNYEKWKLQGGQTPIVSDGIINYTLVNGTAIEMMGMRYTSIAIRDSDTLFVATNGESTLRKGNGEVITIPPPQRPNPEVRIANAAENGFIISFGSVDNRPRILQTTIYFLDPANPTDLQQVENLSGEQTYAVIQDRLLSIRGNIIDGSTRAYNTGRTITGLYISVPTESKHAVGIVQQSVSGFTYFENVIRQQLGIERFDWSTEALVISGIGGVYIRDAACLFSPIRSSVECLAQNESLQWNGLTIDEPGIYTTQIQVAGCLQDSSIEVIASGNFQFPSYCLGQGGNTYFFGQEALRPGTYTSTQMVSGCPRTYSIEAFGSYFTVGETPVCIDTNEVFNWNGMLLTEEGTYRQNRPDTNGCLIPYSVQIYERDYNGMTFDTICQGDTYWLNNEELQFNSVGDYQNLIELTNTCRDTFRQNLAVLPSDTMQVDTMVVIGEDLFGSTISANGQVVVVPNSGLCGYTAYTADVVSSTGAIPIQDQVLLSPNPTSGVLFLKRSTSHPTPKEVRITDAVGRQLTLSNWPSGQLSLKLDLSDFAPGVYVIRIGDDMVERVVVK